MAVAAAVRLSYILKLFSLAGFTVVRHVGLGHAEAHHLRGSDTKAVYLSSIGWMGSPMPHASLRSSTPDRRPA